MNRPVAAASDARQVKHAPIPVYLHGIERLLEDPIAEAILRGELVEGCMSRAIRPEGTSDIAFEEDKPKPAPRKRAPRKKKS